MAQQQKRIEDYGFIGNLRTAALVDRQASMEWLCLPRFDSDACFAALIGEHENGYWQIYPTEDVTSQSRRYQGETLILETLFETASGSVAVIDFMPLSHEGDTTVDVIRIVEGRSGRVEMQSHAVFRFGYGQVAPWIHCHRHGFHAVGGPDGLRLETSIPMHNYSNNIQGVFTVQEGERVPFILTWFPSFSKPPSAQDADPALEATRQWWLKWSAQCDIDEAYREPVVRSLITLKALTHIETGGIIGAASCSLPEEMGDNLNWDYRYTWLRDATFTLYALLASGYREEACAWRQWLLRAAAGDPAKLQPIYGLAGERRLAEHELDWLSGFNGSQPVRIGNSAYLQRQMDIYGEVMDGLHLGRVHHIEPSEDLWGIQCQLIEYLEQHWQDKGASLWELRGDAKHYTHSKIMAWVAVDRVIKGAEDFGLEGDVQRWRALRQRIHDEVCEKGFSKARNSFVQSYGSEELDAVLLLIPQVGFLPAHDSRVRGTIEAIQQELVYEGFVYRFTDCKKREHITKGEGAFFICCFWLVDALVLLGRREEACKLFNKLLTVRNDLGLLAEEYHPLHGIQMGNFPQAFSHVGLINSAHNLSRSRLGRKGPAQSRGEE
ncbi:glycoside hydrolase family 15 protein [Halomonas shantousis]